MKIMPICAALVALILTAAPGYVAPADPDRPVFVAGELLVQFRPERRLRGAWFTNAMGWERLTNHVDLIEIPGEHTSMIAAPEFAAALAGRLDEVSAEARPVTATARPDVQA